MFERTISFWRRLLGRAPAGGTDAPPDLGERRVWVRYPADLTTTYQPAGNGTHARYSARVRNISLGGINLLVSRPFDPGELLSVELPGAPEGGTTTALACVIH